MPTSTYVPIATFTGSGTHSFTGIDQSYNHLIVVNNGRISSGGPDNVSIQVGNGSYDTANNYTYKLFGISNVGTGVSSGANTSAPGMFVGAVDTTYYNVSTTIIHNYSSTAIQKNFIARNGGFNSSGQSNCIWGGQWITTGTAITQLKLTNTNFDSGSTTTLYGLVAQ
jgi:hypothetical protein